MSVIASILVATSLALSGADNDDAKRLDYFSEWLEFKRFVATYSPKEASEERTFEYIQDGREVLINITVEGELKQLLSIPGVATLYNGMGNAGIKTAEACYGDVGDMYSVLQSYAALPTYLIAVGAKSTPDGLLDKRTFEYSQIKHDERIQVNPGDHMVVGAPWHLSGHVVRAGDVNYDILLKQTVAGKLKETAVKGVWSSSATDIGVNDQDTLNGWLVCIAGKSVFRDGQYKFEPVTSDFSKLETIGHLRALAKDVK